MYFQASEYKGKNFLNLNNNDDQLVWLTYTKDSTWPKHFRSLNSMCACVIILVTNHISIDEYRLRFFSKKSIIYLYTEYSIKIRRHILYKCLQYKKS